MSFDITPYRDRNPSEVRQLIRAGILDFPTAGMCRGYAQANLVILPGEYAGDFEAAFSVLTTRILVDQSANLFPAVCKRIFSRQ